MKSKKTSQMKKTFSLVMAVILAFGVFFNAAFVVNAADEMQERELPLKMKQAGSISATASLLSPMT